MNPSDTEGRGGGIKCGCLNTWRQTNRTTSSAGIIETSGKQGSHGNRQEPHEKVRFPRARRKPHKTGPASTRIEPDHNAQNDRKHGKKKGHWRDERICSLRRRRLLLSQLLEIQLGINMP